MQQNYTMIEKELPSLIEACCEFHTMLLDTNVTVYTDHRNLTYALTKFCTQCIFHWHLLLEEFSATFCYKTSDTNFIADVLSRVPTSCMEKESPKATIKLKN